MCRQRIDPAEWDAHGGAALGDHAEWSDRACGMAALRMILLAYLGEAPPLTELVKTGVRDGALTGRGWLHAGIARLAAGFGIPAAAEAVTADELPARLAAAPLIISVTEKFPEDGRKGGHLVIARGTARSAQGGAARTSSSATRPHGAKTTTAYRWRACPPPTPAGASRSRPCPHA
ncbi:MAG TPA: hypothetical protein VMV92_27850 [Streptosporangiaceae bacterium]|nr:hypothetical protein [Streptosporangiaceae bacterium]